MKIVANILLIVGAIMAIAGMVTFQRLGIGNVRGAGAGVDPLVAVVYISQFVGAAIALFGGVLRFVAGGSAPSKKP